MKRFYKETSIDRGEGGWRVLLDGRAMRTPAKAELVVPTSELAGAIAVEWRDVPDNTEIKVGNLGLTRLAATALDRVTAQRERVIEDTAKYAASDLLCYRATEPEGLVRRQHDAWQPLLEWAALRYGAPLIVASGTSFVSQPIESLARLRQAVAAHGDLALSALYNLTHIAGSLVIALAVAEGHLSSERAFAAAQLDELYQIERWGDDRLARERLAGIRKNIDAAALFLALLGDARLRQAA
jgi:chaperone required for assembly of F1-ATPase